MRRLENHFEKVGQIINPSKINLLKIDESVPCTFTINDEIIVMGNTKEKGGTDTDVANRIQNVQQAFDMLENVWRPTKKLKNLEDCNIGVVLCETWKIMRWQLCQRRMKF